MADRCIRVPPEVTELTYFTEEHWQRLKSRALEYRRLKAHTTVHKKRKSPSIADVC